MAVIKGTSAGFVSAAPTADPEGTNATGDFVEVVNKFTTDTALTVNQMGFYIDNATEAANIEMGIYSHDAGNNRPLNLLVSGSGAKGTTSGWKTVTINNFVLEANTTYWLAYVSDNTATPTNLNSTLTAGETAMSANQGTPLADPWTSVTSEGTNLWALYARVTSDYSSTISSGIGKTIGQQDLKTDYPVVEGLEANQKHDGQENNLIPEMQSFISDKEKVLLN